MPLPFYPWQAARDTTVVAVVLVALAAFAWNGAPALEGPADPTDATLRPAARVVLPRPVPAAEVLPRQVGSRRRDGRSGHRRRRSSRCCRGSIAGPTRDPRRRPLVDRRRSSLGLVGGRGADDARLARPPASTAAAANAVDAARDRRPRVRPERPAARRVIRRRAWRDPLERLPSTRGPEWLAGHVADPEMIAPGLREPPARVDEREVGRDRRLRPQAVARSRIPAFDAQIETVGRRLRALLRRLPHHRRRRRQGRPGALARRHQARRRDLQR